MDAETAAAKKRRKKGKGKEKADIFNAVRDGDFDELEEMQLQPASTYLFKGIGTYMLTG